MEYGYTKIALELKVKLECVGWSLKQMGCEHYRPVDNKGRVSKFELFDNSLTMKSEHKGVSELVSIRLIGDGSINVLSSGDAVSCGSKEHFILFMNHESKRNKND